MISLPDSGTATYGHSACQPTRAPPCCSVCSRHVQSMNTNSKPMRQATVPFGSVISCTWKPGSASDCHGGNISSCCSSLPASYRVMLSTSNGTFPRRTWHIVAEAAWQGTLLLELQGGCAPHLVSSSFSYSSPAPGAPPAPPFTTTCCCCHCCSRPWLLQAALAAIAAGSQSNAV